MRISRKTNRLVPQSFCLLPVSFVFHLGCVSVAGRTSKSPIKSSVVAVLTGPRDGRRTRLKCYFHVPAKLRQMLRLESAKTPMNIDNVTLLRLFRKVYPLGIVLYQNVAAFPPRSEVARPPSCPPSRYFPRRQITGTKRKA